MPLQVTGVQVPVLAFIGVEGGVGKTTLALRFARLITDAPTRPNVLLIDMDVHTMSNLTTKVMQDVPIECSGWHECVFYKKDSLATLIDVESREAIVPSPVSMGKCYLLPAYSLNAKGVYDTDIHAHHQEIEGILHSLIRQAIAQYNFSCVVINCGTIITPYMVAAVSLSDRAFWVGNNPYLEPKKLHDWIERLHEFKADIPSQKIISVLNQIEDQALVNRRDGRVYIPYDSVYFNAVYFEHNIGPSSECRHALLLLIEISFKNIRPDWQCFPIPQQQSYWIALIPKPLRPLIVLAQLLLSLVLRLLFPWKK